MAKFPQPYFRAQRGTWCVQLDGRQITLGPDRDEAFRAYHKLMVGERSSSQPVDGPLVVVLLDRFLEWCRNNKAPRTYDWYLRYLRSFAGHAPANLSVEHLKPFHVQEWVDAHSGWKTGKRGAIIAVQRALNWAARQG